MLNVGHLFDLFILCSCKSVTKQEPTLVRAQVPLLILKRAIVIDLTTRPPGSEGLTSSQ
jgi:hypothetical protein